MFWILQQKFKTEEKSSPPHKNERPTTKNPSSSSDKVVSPPSTATTEIDSCSPTMNSPSSSSLSASSSMSMSVSASSRSSPLTTTVSCNRQLPPSRTAPSVQQQHQQASNNDATAADITDDVKDIIQNLKRLESTTYKRDDSMMSKNNGNLTNTIDGFRNVIIQWMYNVANIFDVNHRVVAVATWYVDEAVHRSKQPNSGGGSLLVVQTPTDYQLVSLTALYMSMKLYGNRLFPLVELVKLGRGQFTVDDIASMEVKLVETFQWHLTPPTYLCYLQEFEKLFPGGNQTSTTMMADESPSSTSSKSVTVKDLIFQHAQKLVYDGMFRPVQQQINNTNGSSSTFQNVPPSMIASAAMLLSMEKHGRSLLTTSQYDTFVSRLQKVVNMKPTEISILEDAICLLEPTMVKNIDHQQQQQEQRHEQRHQKDHQVAEERQDVSSRNAVGAEHNNSFRAATATTTAASSLNDDEQQQGMDITTDLHRKSMRDEHESSSPTSVVGH